MMRLIPAVLCGAAVFVLAGCGQGTERGSASDPAGQESPAGSPATPSGDTPTQHGSADAQPQISDLPQWPATCQSRSVVSVDYGRMPRGYATPEEAVANAHVGDVPGGTPMLAPAEVTGAKGPAQVWVVDQQTGDIAAQVSVFRGPDGWFVDGVMTCS